MLPGLFFVVITDGVTGFDGIAFPHESPLERSGINAQAEQSDNVIDVGNGKGLNRVAPACRSTQRLITEGEAFEGVDRHS